MTISQLRHTDHIYTHNIVQRQESIPCVATTCLYAHAQRLHMLFMKVWILTWDNRSHLYWRNRLRCASVWFDEILVPVAQTHLTQMDPNSVFHQDSARPHTVRITTGHFQNNQVEVMEWPACSPDMNHIEHFFCNIKIKCASNRRVSKGITHGLIEYEL